MKVEAMRMRVMAVVLVVMMMTVFPFFRLFLVESVDKVLSQLIV